MAKLSPPRPLEDLNLHLQHPVLAAQLDQFPLLGARQSLLAGGVDSVLLHPAPQARLTDPQVPRDLSDRVSLIDKIQR